MNRCFTFAVLAFASSLAATAAAQVPRDSLAPVVVTATLVPIATAAPTATVTVLTGDDLRAQGISRVLDALRLVPGAEVVASGSFGSQTSLFLRGGNSNYVRVLVDGVSVNDAGGAFDFSTLTVDNIDRIEVVRGPASVLYGSDAVTGVIQLFTRDGRGPVRTRALVGGGSYGSARAELSAAGGNDRVGFSVGVSRGTTEGILPFNNRFTNDVLSALLRLTLDGRTDARVAARWTASNFHYPTDYSGAVTERNAEQTDHRLVLSVDAGRRLTDRVDVRLVARSDEFLPRSNDDKDAPSDTLGFYGYFSRGVRTRRSAEARLNVRVASTGTISLGGETAWERERSSSLSLSQYGPSADGFEASRHDAAFYAQAVGDATHAVSYSVGARLDQNSAFGSFRTVRASVAWVVDRSTRVRVSAGDAFKAPSFYENFATGFVRGNPALVPERTSSAELGVDQTLADGALNVRATGYMQRFRDIIQYTGSAPTPGAPNYYNVAGADADGVEFEAVYRGVSRWLFSGSYAWTGTRVTESGFDKSTGASYVKGEPLIRRAPHTFSLAATRSLPGDGSVRLIGTRVGARDDRDFASYPAAAVRLPAYMRVDGSVVVPLPAGLGGSAALVARVDNALGASYQEIARFAAPGRVLFIGVRVGR